ncbi:MAG: HIT family protein [Acidimicrobiia bacterium]|jgi:histidine triad (HIT) family protein
MGCVFCAIVAGEADASVVATTDRAVAFMDLVPIGEGHTLVVPRAHAVGLRDLDPADAAEVMQLGRRVATAQFAAGLAEGVNLFLADGAVAGQEVSHAHLHVLPRRPDDGLRIQLPSTTRPDRAELDAVAARLTAALL